MFFFELRDGRKILHSGDLRADRDHVTGSDLLKTMMPQLDILYLDTTYCNAQYVFPRQHETMVRLLDLVQEMVDREARTLVCVGSYTIGKEKVFQGDYSIVFCLIFTA